MEMGPPEEVAMDMIAMEMTPPRMTCPMTREGSELDQGMLQEPSSSISLVGWFAVGGVCGVCVCVCVCVFFCSFLWETPSYHSQRLRQHCMAQRSPARLR